MNAFQGRHDETKAFIFNLLCVLIGFLERQQSSLFSMLFMYVSGVLSLRAHIIVLLTKLNWHLTNTIVSLIIINYSLTK